MAYEINPRLVRGLDYYTKTTFEFVHDGLGAQSGIGGGGFAIAVKSCLDRCAGGPVAVVYPDETWYTFVDNADIDEIVESHLKNGQVVERLLTPAHLGR